MRWVVRKTVHRFPRRGVDGREREQDEGKIARWISQLGVSPSWKQCYPKVMNSDTSGMNMHQITTQETDEQAWARIGDRSNYRCGFCIDLVAQMRAAAQEGGATAAIDVLRNYKGMICSSVEWMLWPALDENDPGDQAVS
jgi:hypothetical protein